MTMQEQDGTSTVMPHKCKMPTTSIKVNTTHINTKNDALRFDKSTKVMIKTQIIANTRFLHSSNEITLSCVTEGGGDVCDAHPGSP